MRSVIRPVGAMLVAGVLLGSVGCGQTGPLYLPDSGIVVTRPATPAQGTAPTPGGVGTPAGAPAQTPAPDPASPPAPAPPPSPPPGV